MTRRDFIKSISCAAAVTTVPNLFGKEKVNYELEDEDFRKRFSKGYIIRAYDLKHNTKSLDITRSRIADGKLFPFETIEDCERYISLNYLKLFSHYDPLMDLHVDEVHIMNFYKTECAIPYLKLPTAWKINRNAHKDESMPYYLGKCLWFEIFRLRDSSERYNYSMTIEEIQKHMQDFSATIIERCAKYPSHFKIVDNVSKAKNGKIVLCTPEITLIDNTKFNRSSCKIINFKTYNGMQEKFPIEFKYIESENGCYIFPMTSSIMKGIGTDAISRITAKKC